MRDRLIFTGQLIFTLLVAAFLVVPAILSISAGVTVNYFRGISSTARDTRCDRAERSTRNFGG